MTVVIGGLAVIISALAWVDHYQPLTFYGATEARYVTSYGAPVVNRAGPLMFGPEYQWVIPNGHSTLWFATSFTNNAPFSISVTGFQAPFTGWTGFGAARGYLQSVAIGSFVVGRPFRAFTLAAHASRVLEIAIPVTCHPLGGSEGEASTVVVDIDVLGVSHQVALPTTDVGVAYPTAC